MTLLASTIIDSVRKTTLDGAARAYSNDELLLFLTEALRSFVMRVAGEGDAKIGNHSVNNVLLMNFATDVVQKVTALNLEVIGAHGGGIPARADKIARDAVIWTHLAGDSIQRMKAVRRLKWN